MSYRPGVSFLPLGPCVRDCRIPPYDKDSPYVPPLCSGIERSVHACVCSCIDMYPDWASLIGVGDNIAPLGFVAAVAGDLQCYCENADDSTATTSSVVQTYHFAWDESSLSTANRLLAKAAETCPDDPHTRFSIYVPTPDTNLACVQSSDDWLLYVADTVFGDDPEPTGGTTKDAPLVMQAAPHETLVDCVASALLQPSAFLLEIKNDCGLLLLCPNRNPGGVSFTCPDCIQFCIFVAYSTDPSETFSTVCTDGESSCTITFTITCPGLCACGTGHAVVTFTLDGTPVSSGELAAACGATLTVTSDPLPCNGFSGSWGVHVAWVCDSDMTPCALGTNCVGHSACPNTASLDIAVALGGGVVP